MPDLVLVTSVAVHIGMAWAEACQETGSTYPEGHCVDVSIDLADALDGAGIAAATIWGGFEIGQPDHPAWDKVRDHPVHRDNGMPRGQVGHAWVVLEDKTIVDPTAGQFFIAGPALRIFPPDHQMYGRYHPHEAFTPRE